MLTPTEVDSETHTPEGEQATTHERVCSEPGLGGWDRSVRCGRQRCLGYWCSDCLEPAKWRSRPYGFSRERRRHRLYADRSSLGAELWRHGLTPRYILWLQGDRHPPWRFGGAEFAGCDCNHTAGAAKV
jgi:hypothetical protein